MNKQLRQLYTTRYKTPLLIVLLVLFSLYLFSGLSTINSWKNTQRYYHSEEFVTDFNAFPENYVIGYDEEKDQEIYPTDIEEYRKHHLTVFTRWWEEGPATFYQVGRHYYDKHDSFYLHLVFIFLFVLGFSLFFIDQKSNFNHFLFSLSWTKKELFQGKMTTVVLPIITTVALGTLSNILIRYFGIPRMYVNATFSQFLYSGFSHFIIGILILMAGILLGILLGNLIYGPIVLIIVMLSLLLFSEVYQEYLYYIDALFDYPIHYDWQALVVVTPGIDGTPWFILVFYFVLTILFYFLSRTIFQQISLENNGCMLTVPTLRFPVFLTLSALSILWFVPLFANLSFYFQFEAVIPFLQIVITTLLCLVTSYLIVYIDDWPRAIGRFWYRSFKKVH